MRYDEVEKLLEPGYLPFETGIMKISEEQVHVAALTRMPQVKGKMIDWWFGWVGDTEKYKLWHPKDHLVGDWDEHWRPGHYIGASHLVHEYIGSDIAKLKITFFDPSQIFDVSKFEAANVGAVISGHVGLLEEDVQLGHLVHFVRDTPFGCEMRSRFWIPSDPEDKLARGLLQHCIEEMGTLADILPGIYQKERQK